MSFAVFLFYHQLLKERAVYYAHFVNSSALELDVALHLCSIRDYSLLRPIRKNASFATIISLLKPPPLRKVKVSQLCPTLGDPTDYSPWNSPGQNTGVGSCSLLQGIFPIQGLNPGLLRCTHILYQLIHKGSPRLLEWVAYPFSSVSSRPSNQTRVLLYCR